MYDKLISGIIFLLGSIFSQEIYAHVPVGGLPAPQPYHWEEEIDTNNGTVKLILKSADRVNTDIHFTYNLITGAPTEINQVDEKRQIVVARPGRHTWMPHPGQRKSLESLFIEDLEDLTQEGLKVPFMQTASDGTITYSTIEDYISLVKKYKSKTTMKDLMKEMDSVSLAVEEEAFVQLENAFLGMSNKIQKKVQTLVKKMNPDAEAFVEGAFKNLERAIQNEKEKVNPTGSVWCHKIFETFDVVEPFIVKSDMDSNKKSINAFLKYPISIYTRDKKRLLFAIHDLAKAPTFDPLEFMKDTTYPRDIKLAILTLLTHNHHSEAFFAKAVVCTDGPQMGWQVFLDLNQLYSKEAEYWKKNNLLTSDADIKKLYSGMVGQIQFLNNNLDKCVNLNDLPKAKGVPYIKRYHLYGAFVLSCRLKNELGLPNVLISQIVRRAGQTYRAITTGCKSPEMDTIEKIYQDGFELAKKYCLKEK